MDNLFANKNVEYCLRDTPAEKYFYRQEFCICCIIKFKIQGTTDNESVSQGHWISRVNHMWYVWQTDITITDKDLQWYWNHVNIPEIINPVGQQGRYIYWTDKGGFMKRY